MNALAIFRDYNDEVVALFPELPGSKKPRECLVWSLSKGFHALDYERTMYNSRPAKSRDYRDSLKELEAIGHPVNIIQKASQIMHERRKKVIDGE